MKYANGAAIFGSIFFLLFSFSSVYSVMTGGVYEIYGDSFSLSQSESTGTSSGGVDYALFGSIDAFGATSTGGTFTVRGGHFAAEQGILIFSLSSSSLQLGTLSTGAVSIATTTATVYTDSFTGYSLALSEDGNLRSGVNDIDDVGDGAVTAGSEEYGVRTTGADGLLSADTAISGSLAFATATGTVYARATNVGFRASVAPATTAGTYSHIVTFTLTVNP